MIAAPKDPVRSAKYKTLDANEAVASVAYRLSEVIAIYPITPASTAEARGGQRHVAAPPL